MSTKVEEFDVEAVLFGRGKGQEVMDRGEGKRGDTLRMGIEARHQMRCRKMGGEEPFRAR